MVDKGYYGTMSDRDLSHFSYEVRDGGVLGYAGVNGVATFEAEFMLFLLGLSAIPEAQVHQAGNLGPGGFQRLLPAVFLFARSLRRNSDWPALPRPNKAAMDIIPLSRFSFQLAKLCAHLGPGARAHDLRQK